MSEEKSHLSSIPVLRDLTDSELDTLDGYFSEVWLQPGDTLFNEGDREQFVGFIMQGSVEIVKNSVSGQSQQIARLNKGSTIGEMSLLDSLPRSATVKAIMPTLFHILRQEDFREIERESPAIAIKILKFIARSLSMNMRKTSNTLSDSRLL